MCSRQRPVFMAEGRSWGERKWRYMRENNYRPLCFLNVVRLLRSGYLFPERRHQTQGKAWKHVSAMGQAVTYEGSDTHRGEATCPENQCPGRHICLAWKPIRSSHNTAFNSRLVETGTVGWAPSPAPHLVLSTKQDTDIELPKSLSY